MLTVRTGPPAAPAVSVDWARELRQACNAPSRIGVAFQPIVDLARGSVAGYEVLARFPHSGPEAWFAAARRHGLAEAFEAAVLARTLAARTEAPPNTFVSINASPDALLSAPVQAVLARAGSLEATVLEVTEQTVVDDYAALREMLRHLRARGALVAVDDAGAGYASLSHVMRLRPDFVRLDRALVSDCDVDETKLAALEMLGGFVGRIDGWVVAEGIERQEELDALLRVGIPLGQGYHLARPAPGMGALDPRITGLLARRAEGREMLGGVSPLVDTVPIAPAREEAVELLAGSREGRFVIVVDHHGRPCGIVRREDGSDAPLREATTTGAGDLPAEVALRAMTRPIETRFDPLVCCDGRGQALGLVLVERLVSALARP